MKKWNTEGNLESFTELVDPLIKLATEITNDPNNEKDLEYTGFEHGSMNGGNCASGQMVSSKKYREYINKEKGRPTLGLVIELAFQLGMEQGRRFFNLHLNHKQKRCDFLLEKIKNRLSTDSSPETIKYLIEEINEELQRKT